jgi:ubiquinone/menaquinone biosynthesis C-methylase UbiE
MAPHLSLERLRATWAELGATDPLWAVVTKGDKRGGKWDQRDFLKTGERDVARYHDLLCRFGGGPQEFDHVLDFGCGVGRLSLAWSRRAKRVTGVDISPGMIARGKEFAKDTPNVELRLNDASDLRCFPAEQFDLVFSHICLQHIPWRFTAGYLAEFARVCRRGGWIAIQLPSQSLKRISFAAIRKRVVELLPFGLDRAYRKWRHGCPVIFEMYFIPPENVIDVTKRVGLTERHREPDQSAGDSVKSFIYLFQKQPG